MNPRTPGQPSAAPARTSPVRRLALRSGVAIGSGLALAGAVTAMAVPLANAAPTSRTTTIRLLSVTKATTRIPSGGVEVDIDKNGAGKVVGADTLICRVISRSKPPKCAASVDLTGGDLFFQVTGTRTGASGKLVGGTGKYARDSGTITATNISATKTRVVIKVRK